MTEMKCGCAYERNVRNWQSRCKDQLDRISELERVIASKPRPVLFIEQGSLLNADAQIDLLFQFNVVWVRKGYNTPLIYEATATN